MGNFGQNPYDPYGHLVVENGVYLKKMLNLTMKIAIIQKAILDKSLLWESFSKNICQIWNNFYSFWEIIFFVQGLGQKIITVDQMSPVE